MIDRLMELIQEKVENRYYGKYRAVVTDNQDPNSLGRLMVKVPSLMGENELGWAMPCFPYGGGSDRGFYMVPEVGDGVWVEFEAGNLSYPIWSGTWWGNGETPKGFQGATPVPDLKILKSRCGHLVQLDDTSGSESITITEGKKGSVIIIDKAGIKITDGANTGNEVVMNNQGVTCTDKNGNKVVLNQSGIKVTDGVNSGNEITMDSQGMVCKDKSGNTITMGMMSGYPAGKGIEINGSTRVCLEGLIDWLLTHKHIGNLGVPTPLFPDDMITLITKRSIPQGGILSDLVKVK
jgi:hypothetical protein